MRSICVRRAGVVAAEMAELGCFLLSIEGGEPLVRTDLEEIIAAFAERHLTAEEVYKTLLQEGEEVGLATVYRVLTQFEAAGLVKRHHFEGGNSVFELESGQHHDHIVCVKCGKVEEFRDEVIEQRQREIACAIHFKLTDHSLCLYGLCQKCQDCAAAA